MGGRIAADRLGQARTTRKADNTFVTQVDFEVQNALLDVIAAVFADHAVLVEEDVERPERHASVDRADYCWVIDPLDGTRNFSRTFPVFATSVAVMRDGWPVVGAVCHAMTGQVFAAAAGGGATLDGKPVRVRDAPPTPDTMLFMRGRSGHPAPPPMHRWLDRHAFRNMGPAALHLAFVAAGIVDGAYHQQCKLWDVAAGALMVTEAGGVATRPNGAPLFPVHLTTYNDEDMGILAAGPNLHAHMLNDVRGDSGS
jgi:myo-inositol-1(or 4)-monophosphatase